MTKEEKEAIERAKNAARIAMRPNVPTDKRLAALALVNVASPDGIYVSAIRTEDADYIMPHSMFRVLCIIKAQQGVEVAKKTMAEWFDMDLEDAAIMDDDQAFPPWRKRRKDASSE